MIDYTNIDALKFGEDLAKNYMSHEQVVVLAAYAVGYLKGRCDANKTKEEKK